MQEENQINKREAEEVGCFGLLEGVAKNLYTHEVFYASLCTKNNGPFYCPECFSDVVIRKCCEKKDHFAHHARLTPVIGSNESKLHKDCKDEICNFLNQQLPDGKWETERIIPERKENNIPELRPDISGWIENQRVAIEIQVSYLSISKIIKRTIAYSKRGMAILWIVPLTEPLGDLPFRPRLYERYLHSIYYGRTYYWWSGLGLWLKPVHYADATRKVEYREWYDENGEHQEGGGYERRYKIIKTPKYGADLNIVDSFNKHNRPAFTPDNERKEVPACIIWQDNLKKWW